MGNLEKYIESFKIKHELFLNSCDSIEEKNLWDKESCGEMDAFYSNDIISIIIRLVAVDGNISQEETDALNRTFGFNYTLDELVEVYNACGDYIGQEFDENLTRGIAGMRKINAKLADAYKDILSLICKIIIESDGIISATEVSELNRIQAMVENY